MAIAAGAEVEVACSFGLGPSLAGIGIPRVAVYGSRVAKVGSTVTQLTKRFEDRVDLGATGLFEGSGLVVAMRHGWKGKPLVAGRDLRQSLGHHEQDVGPT